MQVERRWVIARDAPGDAEELARRLGVTPVTARVLINRGVGDPDRARSFLQPQLNDLHRPSLLPDLERAADRVRQAVERSEPIVIYGDYDVDGISATAILMRCLALVGARPSYYIPDRLEEGYGLNAAAVKRLAEEGARLLVTVDCGISAVEEIALARELGLDVVVTDHHEPGDEAPSNALLINPKLPGCPYPFRELAGAGLAFKLAWAIGESFSNGQRVSPEFREFLLDAVSLAALGTIADVVPLHGENRVLAHFGLRGLSASTSPGMIALREAGGLDDAPLSASDVVFRLAPRLNAAGRLGSARRAVELLTTDSLERAREIATQLGRENSRRQRLQESVLTEGREMIKAAGGVAGKWSIVLAQEGWHAGVVGIVASRLAEEYWRPTVLLTLDGEEGHGSARSVGPLHLFEALHECAGLLVAFGGHARAAGLRLARSDVEAFKEAFEKSAGRRLCEEHLVPLIPVDAEVRLCDVTKSLLDDMALLEPCGEGNAEPVLAAFDVSLPSGVRRMGSAGRHMSFWVNQNGAAFRAVAFGRGDLAEEMGRHRTCALAFVPRLNRWRGRESIELEVRDIKLGEAGRNKATAVGDKAGP